MVETVFDTLSRAALFAISSIQKDEKIIPIMISATITDLSQELIGQTIEAFYTLVHVNPLSVGLNCALGPKELEPYVVELNKISRPYKCSSKCWFTKSFGEYDETPMSMANFVKRRKWLY